MPFYLYPLQVSFSHMMAEVWFCFLVFIQNSWVEKSSKEESGLMLRACQFPPPTFMILVLSGMESKRSQQKLKPL